MTVNFEESGLDCLSCGAPMRLEIGEPAEELHGLETRAVCPCCPTVERIEVQPWDRAEVRRRVAIVRGGA